MNDELIKKAEEIVNKNTMRQAGEVSPEKKEWEADRVVSLIDEDGCPSSSMATASKADGFKWIAFCTGLFCNKVNRIKKDPRACVYLFDCKSFSGISLRGEFEIITDQSVKDEMWYKELGNHFSGADDANYCVLKFTPRKYNLFVDFKTLCGEF